MREPKFVPGERVWLESKDHPEFNGVHIVASVRFYDQAFNVHTEKLYENVWLYKLDGANARPDGWYEKALRKLPPETPATFDASIWVPNKESVK